MLLNGLILLTTLAIGAKCLESELTVEAAFQGRCGRNSPCEQLCYEIHYGMYECGCTEGYELDKNGYSCQEINSTFSSGADRGSREEDILYQKGVSFSAKLEGPSLSRQNLADETGDEDDSQLGIENSQEASSSAEMRSDQSLLKSQIESIRDISQAHSTSSNKPTMSVSSEIPQAVATTAMYSSGDDDNFYAKQDMSIYDDVNNNRLNIRPYRPDTYQIQVVEEAPQTSTLNSAISTTNSISLLPSGVHSGTNTTEPIVTTQPEPCTLDCGLEGVCEYVDESATTSGATGVISSTENISSTGAATTSPITDNGRMKCQCPFGKTGKGCLEDAKINIPRFTKKSWLAFPALRGAYKHVQLRIEFRPESFDGIILLTGERDDLTGDFMALLIHQGFIEFWFDCGSGTGSVRSKETVLLNQWNSVTIYRHRWDAWLVLNHETRVQGRSKGLFSRITFREPVFLGGTGNITGLAKRLPVYEGIVGCIRRFIANEHEYKFDEHPLGDVTKGFGIQDCTTDKCVKYPCQHGGKCLPSDQGAVCLCPLGYGGDLCEMRLDLQVPSFNGSSYLRYAPLGDSALIWLEIEIIIKAHRGDGLLLYSGHEDSGDFIALSLINGFVEFTFDLGSGLAFVRSRNPISLGQWHSVKVSRTARLAVLKVDQSEEVMTISPNGFWHLSLPHSLFLGGTHAMKKPLVGVKDQQASFVGCIQKVVINGRTMSIISEALGGTNVDNCPHACVARPCGPLAECVPLLDNYECRCSPYNSICNKAEEVSLKQTHNTSNNQNIDNSKSNSRSDNFSTLKSKSEQHHPPTRTHSKHAHHKKAHDTMTKHSNVQHYKQHWKHEKSRASKHHSSNGAGKESKKDVEQNDSEMGLFSQKTLAENMNLPSEGNLDVNADSLVADGYLTDYAAETSSPKGWQVKPTQAFDSAWNVGKATKSLKHEAANFDGDEYLTSDARLLAFEDHAKEQIDNMDLSPAYLTLDDNDYESNDGSSDNDNFEKIDDDILDDYVVEDNAGHDDNNFNDKVKPERIKIPHYYSRKHHKKSDEQRDPLHRMQDDMDIDTDTNNLFDGEEDYRAKDLIRDMKRIMKNGNSGNTNGDGGGSAAIIKTSAEGPNIHHAHSKMMGTPNYKRTVGACFTGTDSYFHYNDAETMSHVISYKIDLNLRFKTRSKYGVILWSGRQSALDNDDFLSLGIENGYLHLRYNLGSGETNILFNGTKVSDGLWHRVRATRKLQEGSLEVDGRKSVLQRSPGKLAQLNTDTGLYVGGMPNVDYYTRHRYYSGIVGCISEIVLAGEVQLTLDPATLGAAHNVEIGIL